MRKQDWIWMPHPAHFICAADCRYFLATYIGDWIISTVGERVPDSEVREIFAQSRNVVLEGKGDDRFRDYMRKIGFEPMGLGKDELYETMVFRAKPATDPEECCPYRILASQAVATERYATSKEAYDGHMRYCAEYANTPVPSPTSNCCDAGIDLVDICMACGEHCIPAEGENN